MNGETYESTCRHCQAPIIRRGNRWGHVDGIEFNTYWYCRTTVAGPGSAEQIRSLAPCEHRATTFAGTCADCGAEVKGAAIERLDDLP